MHDQYVLDFTSRANERCAKVLGLRSARLPVDMTRGRLEGVIELVQRLALLCRDLPEALAAPFSVDCQVVAIAARIERRKTVSEKTVRNWTADAKLLGLLHVDYASQQYGGSRWNTYTVDFAAVIALITSVGRPSQAVLDQEPERPGKAVPQVAGSGRKRAVTVTAPGAVTASAPNNVFTNVSDKHSPPPLRATGTRHGCIAIGEQATQLRELANASEDEEVVVSDFLEDVKEECIVLGMSSDGARGAVARALSRGLTHVEIGELVQLYREASARDARMTAGWLYRWLSGQSAPPKASGSAPKPPQHCGGRGDGLTRQQVDREALRARIIRHARSAGASEEEIRQRCEQAGVEY
jgi:hypothetical protein